MQELLFVSCAKTNVNPFLNSNSALTKVIKEFNQKFLDQSSPMKISTSSAHLRIRRLLSLFNKPWHPKEQRELFIETFSFESWKKLPARDKNKHTIKSCVACSSEHAVLTKAFPYKPTSQKPAIVFNKSDLSTPSSLGQKALLELNNISNQHFQVSACGVLTSTPKSNVVLKPSHQQRQSERRKIVREAKM